MAPLKTKFIKCFHRQSKRKIGRQQKTAEVRPNINKTMLKKTKDKLKIKVKVKKKKKRHKRLKMQNIKY